MAACLLPPSAILRWAAFATSAAAFSAALARFFFAVHSLSAERRDVERSVASLDDSDHRLVEHDFGDLNPSRQQRYQLEPRVNVARLDERLIRDVGIVGHLHSRHVGQDSPAEAHLDVVGVNLAAERAADLVEDGLAALRDDRVQVGRGIEQDRAGENHDGSDNCGGDYDDSAHTRALTSATSKWFAARRKCSRCAPDAQHFETEAPRTV